MYLPTIILRYLRRKLTPLFAAAAVTLCTAMVIIVISVMGGFLQMMRQAAQTLEGDMSLTADVTGFPYYQQAIDELTRLPQVHAASPVVRAYGLLKIRDRVHTVEVLGIQPTTFNQVVNYRDTLHWKQSDMLDALDRQYQQIKTPDPAHQQAYRQVRQRYEKFDPMQLGMTLDVPKEWNAAPGNSGPAGLVCGIHVSPSNRRDQEGKYDFSNNDTLGKKVTLTVLPLTQKGTILEPAARTLTVVNEFKSGLYEIDANRVFVHFDLLQKMQKMDAYPAIDPNTGQSTGQMEPARASSIVIRGKPGVPLETLRTAVVQQMKTFLDQHPDMPLIYPMTWQEKHSTFLGAVEHEKSLLTILFGIISIVAVAMIAVIFYMIVLEKTRDIGTLRAIGASRSDIMGIFLGYGLAIGLVGASLGYALAWAVVTHINQIQDWLNRTTLAITGGQKGFMVWDPRVYYFDQIPNRLDAQEVAAILLVAVLSSVAGAIIPAILAARVDPVQSLRYE